MSWKLSRAMMASRILKKIAIHFIEVCYFEIALPMEKMEKKILNCQIEQNVFESGHF